ncbi:MAM domain-containing glycosylphosphatidylinositol anchor protein 1 [Elysia marginata]|uniref:MAM domain-containing glycosylphosphatidylinositol anchor protein 1 n=1 Tax=Elysia marginata TaxID=1093978 RepID=A0AAV4HRB7_9GAST|nr:MAM domain-containing glycosylphosphatidylinositol anchor protein 1 [Elysia marginata]
MPFRTALSINLLATKMEFSRHLTLQKVAAISFKKCFFLILLLSFPSLHHLAEASRPESSGCSFNSDGCTYNIYLSSQGETPVGGDSIGDAPRSVQLKEQRVTCGQANKRVVLDDQIQNDYSAKLDNMEKSFSFLKDAHEQRLKELEGTIQKLVNTSATEANKKDNAAETTRFSARSLESRRRFGDPYFMKRLESEFEKIRRDLRDKASELLDTQTKLNETSARMHEQQLARFKASKQLLNAENQITALRRERAILKNQLKDRSYKLSVNLEKANECEEKTAAQQNEILKLFRSESTLKEDLLTVEEKFNRTKEEHALLQQRHSELKSRQNRIRRIMKIRERELITCYSAKTSTFCGFEDPKICGFTNINDTTDFFDWARVMGRTPSSKTGPSKDHTCGAPTDVATAKTCDDNNDGDDGDEDGGGGGGGGDGNYGDDDDEDEDKDGEEEEDGDIEI